MWTFPARFLVEFFDNHGMLGLRGRPRWRTVSGGSARYVEALTAPFADRIRLVHPGARDRALRGPRRGHARRRRARGLRRGRDRRPRRPGAGDARRRDAGRARDPRRVPLPGQRGGPAHRPRSAPAPPAGMGELELPPARRRERTGDGDLPHEPPAVARRRARLLRDAQPHGRDRPGARSSARSPTRTRSTPSRARPPSAATTRSAAATARTSAAPTGAGASTRTASRSAHRAVAALGREAVPA